MSIEPPNSVKQFNLRGALIVVRPLNAKDSQSVLNCIYNNSKYFSKGSLNRLPQTDEQFLEWIHHDPRLQSIIYGAFDGTTCLGFIGLENCMVGQMNDRALGVWYGFDESTKGSGIATKSVAFSLNDYLESQPMRPRDVVFHIHKSNTRSLKLANRFNLSPNSTMNYHRGWGRESKMLNGFSASTKEIK